MLYRVTSRSGLQEFVRALKPTHLVSLIDPESPAPDRPSGVAVADHLLFRFHDLDTTDAATGGPTAEVADALVVFALRLHAEARVLVHCEAGISRSTAAALALDLAAPGPPPGAQDRLEAAWVRLFALRPEARPNRGLLRLADTRLGLGGRLAALNRTYCGDGPT
jgi:predicted protein tyrosine phosphatase